LSTTVFKDLIADSLNKPPAPSFARFELPYQLDRVSTTSGGIYYFSLRFPSDYELGLSADADPKTILGNLKSRVDRYAQVLSRTKLDGFLEDSKAEHIRTRLLLSGGFSDLIAPSELLQESLQGSLEIRDLAEVITVLRFAFASARPIYIGMCFDQSLHQRVGQHVDGQTGLVPLLHDCKLAIMDVVVHCLTLPYTERARLRSCERVIQAIFKPVGSIV
jgi:hypothetical protein